MGGRTACGSSPAAFPPTLGKIRQKPKHLWLSLNTTRKWKGSGKPPSCVNEEKTRSLPGAPAFEFAGARSFAVFEATGFRFTEAPDLPAKENEECREDNSYRKIL